MPQPDRERPTLDFENDPRPTGSFGGGFSGDFLGAVLAGMQGAAEAIEAKEAGKPSEQSTDDDISPEASPDPTESPITEPESVADDSENGIENTAAAMETEGSLDQRVQVLEEQVQAVNEKLAERQQVLENLQSQFDQMQATMQEMQTSLQEMQLALDTQDETHDQAAKPNDVDTSEEKREDMGAYWKHPILAVNALATNFVGKVGSVFDRYRQLDNKKQVGIALGAVGVATAIAWWAGAFDSIPGSGGGSRGGKSGSSGQNAIGMLPVKKQPTPPGGPVEIFSDTARTVHHGEGWYETFHDLGIPQDQWADRLDSVGPELAKDGWAYWDEPAGEWRISQSGQLPDDVLNFIKNA